MEFIIVKSCKLKKTKKQKALNSSLQKQTRRQRIVMKLKAFVLINVNLGCETDVLKALKDVQGFDEAFAVLGDYDIVVRVTAKTMDELNDSITNIRRLQNVRSTTTMITREP